MANQLMPYLIFPGTCKEALTFYCDCLGGEIAFLQTVGESPLKVDDAWSHRVFHSEFRVGEVRFRASDNMPNQELVHGINFALFVTFAEKERQVSAFEKLVEGGKVIMPLEGNFGMLCDRYHIQWMLVHDPEC